jgi:alkylation response protein AidB-like acyl-CoA dehydrogenase
MTATEHRTPPDTVGQPSQAQWWPTAARFGVAEVLSDLSARASERDATRETPAAEIRRLQRAGIPALRIPEALGGRGISLTTLFTFVAELAEADPSVAHALRNHFAFVELTLRSPPGSVRRGYLAGIVAGDLVGGSFSELRASKAGIADFSTALSSRDDRYVLNGEKFYSTGNVYCDVLFVKAVDQNREPVTVVVPATRAGVDVTDDWDGIGQRLTGSGSTRFHDVEVSPREVLPEREFTDESRSYSATSPSCTSPP